MNLLRQFLLNPGQTGSLAPSSQALVQAMLASSGALEGKLIVELGPGTGPITQEIYKSFGKCRYIGFEVNTALAEKLRLDYPGITIHEISASQALDVMEASSAHHVVSSIPFFNLPQDLSREIIKAAYDVLQPGGSFSTFMYWPGFYHPRIKGFLQTVTGMFGEMKEPQFVMRNFPPATVFTWLKGLE